MTAAQMKYEFEVGYDRITNFDAPGYTNKEISTFLTRAQEKLVLDLYRGGDHYKEELKKSLVQLKTVVVRTQLNGDITPGTYPNSYAVNLPEDVLLVYNDTVRLITGINHFYAGKTIEDVAVKPVDDDFYHANKKNPFKKPSIDLVWRIDDKIIDTLRYKRHTYVIEANTTIDEVYIHYYEKPSPIIVQDGTYAIEDGNIDNEDWVNYTTSELSCILDPITHREIVERAIKLAYAAVQDEKGYQISSAEEQK